MMKLVLTPTEKIKICPAFHQAGITDTKPGAKFLFVFVTPHYTDIQLQS